MFDNNSMLAKFMAWTDDSTDYFVDKKVDESGRHR